MSEWWTSAVRWLCWWRPPFYLRTAIINLKSDKDGAIRGVVWSTRGAWYVLKDASALKVGHAATPIDGDVVIPRSNIEFVQVLP